MLSSRGRNALPPPWLQTEKHCHVTHQRFAPIAWFVFWKQSLFGIVVHRLTFLSCFLQSRQLHSRYGLVPSGHSAVTLATVRSTPFLGLGFSFRRCRALLRLGLLDPSDGKRNTCDILRLRDLLGRGGAPGRARCGGCHTSDFARYT